MDKSFFSQKKRSKQPQTSILVPQSKSLHHIWQIDGLELAKLRTGEEICSITVSDEYSGSLLMEGFFAFRQLSQVPLIQIKNYFEQVFQQWGLPEMIKVDNGQPWKNSLSDFPTVLALWWIGLGIKIRWNRPRRPQENAVVENLNGLVTRWTNLHEQTSIESLKEELKWIGTFQREKIKVRKYANKTRLAQFPTLYDVIRPYSEQNFDFYKCQIFLQDNYQWNRIVSKAGQIDFLYQRIYIGRKFVSQTVSITYKAQENEFEVTNPINKTFKIPDFNLNNILLFSLFKHIS